MASLLALLSSIAFGAGDFAGGLASRRSPLGAVLVWSQLLGLAAAGAVAPWLADLTKHDEAAGVTDGRMTLGAPIRQEVAGDRAYVVLNVTYSIKSRGVPVQAVAQMTFALRKEADGWRIGSWTYAGPPETKK